jgi:hypothetical protein
VKLVGELRGARSAARPIKLRGMRPGRALAVSAADAPPPDEVCGELMSKTGLSGGGGCGREGKGLACNGEERIGVQV